MKRHIVSALVTFVATFGLVILAVVVDMPAEQLMKPETYQLSTMAGIINIALRAAVKAVAEKYLVN